MLSGGVDSAVSAALLVEAGYDVTGVFMKNWTPLNTQTLADCPWEKDQADAESVASKLGIAFQSINFEQDYKERVVDYMLAEYQAGRTPNPDVLCNKEIKFGLFFDWAMKNGFDLVASGHYARLITDDGRVLVARGLDEGKDQSYFLWAVPGDRLAKTLLPIGDLRKSEVRRLAQAKSLPVADKPDSQGICFIGHLELRDWLRQELKPEPGNLVTLAGQVVGRHEGSILYTIGQRHGLTIIDKDAVAREYGLSAEELPRLFVVGKDLKANTVTIAPEVSSARANQVVIHDVIWHVPATELAGSQLKIQARYRQKTVDVIDWQNNQDGLTVNLGADLKAPAPGQFAVLYLDDKVVAGGVIHSFGRL